jgi:CheY-like chemotaxis protein
MAGELILLVEDNKDTLKYLALVLGARGHVVTVAERLSEAQWDARRAEEFAVTLRAQGALLARASSSDPKRGTMNST